MAPVNKALLPSDPANDIYLRFCYVCLEEARENQEHIKNYGGIVCFSCRAFFRRAQQRSNNKPTFECKFGGNCSLNVKNRRRCGSCRHTRCLQAGMKPEAVLTDDQKLIRFRKIIEKSDSQSGAKIVFKKRQPKKVIAPTFRVKKKIPRINWRRERSETPQPSTSTVYDLDMGEEEEVFIEDSKSFTAQSRDSRLVLKIEPLRRKKRILKHDDYSDSDDETENPTWNQYPSTSIDVQLKQEIKEEPRTPRPRRVSEKRKKRVLKYDDIDDIGDNDDINDITNNDIIDNNYDDIIDNYYDDIIENKNGDISDDNNYNDNKGKDDEMDKQLKKEISKIIHKYEASMLLSPIPADICEKMASVHIADSEVTLEKKDVLKSFVSISSQFHHFASSLRQFKQLFEEDQKRLLQKNSPIYLQFVGACYFLAHDKREQLRMLHNFKTTSHHEAEENRTEMETDESKSVTVEAFVGVSKLFKRDIDINYFSNPIDHLKFLSVSTVEQRAAFAYMLLFDDRNLNLISDADVIRDATTMSKFLFDKYVGKDCDVTMADIVESLSKMAIFCTYNIDWKDKELNCDEIPKLMQEMPYTVEEEVWIKKQFKDLDEANGSVLMGDDILEEFAMLSLDVPLSKNFMKNCVLVVQERIRRIYKSQDLFCHLSNQSQAEILALKNSHVFALIHAKAANCSDGTEQLYFSLGLSELELWNSKYQSVFNGPNKLRKISIVDSCSHLPPSLFDSLNVQYQTLIKVFEPVVQHPELYRLVKLLVLTKLTGKCFGMLDNLHQCYMLLLRRRLAAGRFRNLNCFKGDQSVLAQVALVLQCVEKLGNILQIIANPHDVRAD